MNTALHEDEAKLAVLVLAVLVQVLSDGDSLLDQEIQVLGKVRREAIGLQDAQNLAACHIAHQRDTEAVTQGHTDLRWSEAFLGELADMVTDILGLHLYPSW